MDDILSQIIAYAPDKIDTELKARAMVQGPRNMADGGQIIGKPGGVVEPGVMYYGKNVMSGSPTQQAENIRRQEESFKKISNLFKNKDYTGLKLATRPARIEAGTQQDTGGKLNTNQQKQIKEAIDGGPKTQNAFAKKLGISKKQFLEGIEKSKSKITTELSESMKKMRFTPDVQLQQKMFYEILENPNATVQSMAKKFKVAEKEITKKSSQLLKNVYTQNVAITKTPAFDIDSRGKATLKSWLPNQYESTKNFLNNFSNIDGLKKVQTENMGILLANAYRDKPKKFAEAMKTLTAYNDFKNNLPKGMKVDLDHPLSKEFIKGSGASPDKLLYVSPVDRGFNRGFKKQIGDRYAKALLQFKKSGLQKDKTAINNIRTLADRVGVNIGDVKGSKLTFGTSKFNKNKNFAQEYLDNIKEQNLVADNLKDLQKTKEGKQLIKDANFKKGQIKPITKIQSKGIAKKLNAAGFKCKLSNGLTCNDPRAYTQSIKENMAKIQQGDDAAIAKINKLGKGMNAFKGAAKFTGWTLLAELGIAAPLAAVDYAKGANKDEIISNATYGLFGKSEDEQLREKYSDYGQAKDFQKTYDKLLKQESALDDQTGYGPIINPQNVKNTEKKLMKQSKQFDSVLPPSQGLRSEFDLGKFLNMVVTDQQRDKLFADQKAQRAEEIGILKPSTGLESYDNFMEGGIASLNVKK